MSNNVSILSTIIKHLPGRHDQQRHAGENGVGRPSKDPLAQYSNASGALEKVVGSLWGKKKLSVKNYRAQRNVSLAVKRFNTGVRAYARYGDVDDARAYFEYANRALENAAKAGADKQKILDAQEAIDALSAKL